MNVSVYMWLLQVPMEFRSQRGRGGGDSHGYSSSSRRHEEKPARQKRRTADDDRSSYRHSRVDTHKVSSVDSASKESSADSRRAASEFFEYWYLSRVFRSDV